MQAGPKETYDQRPDVLEVKPQSHSDLGSDWKQIRQAHLEAVAQMLELYPDREIYFLARDSELLYDFARAATQDEPAVQKRIHLLNVSRSNMGDAHIEDYLAQEGISKATLQAGKKILFVDTGFSGTIPREIMGHFPAKLREQIQTHLICSSNESMPSSRMFLTSLNSESVHHDPSKMHGTIIDYEHMPRFTFRSHSFVLVNGRWQALSEKDADSDGEVSRKEAKKYMEDMAYFATRKETRLALSRRRAEWKKLRTLIAAGDKPGLIQSLQKLVKDHPDDPLYEAMARDALEAAQTNLELAPKKQPSLTEVGLEQISSGGNKSNKNLLIDKHPEWASILKNPATAIDKAIQKDDFGKIAKICDVINDDEFWKILIEKLRQRTKLSRNAKDLIVALLESKDPESTPFQEMAEQMFVRPRILQQPELARAYAKRASRNQLINTFGRLISNSYKPIADMGREEMAPIVYEMVSALLPSSMPSEVSQYVVNYARNYPKETVPVIQLMAEKGSPEILATMPMLFAGGGKKPAGLSEIFKTVVGRLDANGVQVYKEAFDMYHVKSEAKKERELIRARCTSLGLKAQYGSP